MTTSELGRRFAIIVYVAFTVIVLLGVIQTISHEKYFHIPIFTFLILANCLGAISAHKYHLAIELRINLVCFVMMIIIGATSMSLLTYMNPTLGVYTSVIVAMKGLWYWYRLSALKILRTEAIKIGERQAIERQLQELGKGATGE